MNENPFQSPGELSSARYYTDDITTMPWRLIWRVVRRQGLVGYAILLPLFGFRKLTGSRFPANAGLSRPEKNNVIEREELEKAADDGHRQLEQAMEQCGLEPLHCSRAPYIGNMSYVVSNWRDPNGLFWGSVTHIDVCLGELRERRNCIACISWLTSGQAVETGTGNSDEFVPEMIPPGNLLEIHDLETPVSQVIDRHRRRIAELGEAVPLSREEILRRSLLHAQEIFDFMVERGFFTPLTPEEVDRLTQPEAELPREDEELAELL